MNVVRRHGGVVHRPASPATPAIHRLLRHIHDEGFRGAPEPRGFDADGDEMLTFLDFLGFLGFLDVLDGEVHTALTPEPRTP
ncbi:hypothetical protein AB0B50_28190 [Streptomyces sp. NPDC041068]|uniref:hypothetical protein n=1 Tax=Streptomyces sp. NPDC041068 TaxID=3155130 RepID=UPI0033EF6233